MTIDEQISALDDNLRRLKIEYEVFFNGGSKRPPNDMEWKVTNAIKRLSDGTVLTYPQRFKFNAIAQRYAVFSDLWRQKMKIKEEGYRRPQDAILSIQGLRTMREDEPVEIPPDESAPFTICCSNPDLEQERVERLFEAMVHAKRLVGEQVPEGVTLDNFRSFVRRKTEQIRSECGCEAVEYTVEVEGGQARLKAKAHS